MNTPNDHSKGEDEGRCFLMRIAFLGRKSAGLGLETQNPKDKENIISVLRTIFTYFGEEQAQFDCASRTDAAVHARDLLISVRCQRKWTAAKLLKLAQKQCPEFLHVHNIAIGTAPELPQHIFQTGTIHKEYRYLLHSQSNPFLADYAWQHLQCLDETALQDCIAFANQQSNWSAFRRRGEQRKELPKHKIQIKILKHDQHVCLLSFHGQQFFYKQIRSITGALQLCCSQIHTKPELRDEWLDDFMTAFSESDHANQSRCAQAVAPAHGLCLWKSASLIDTDRNGKNTWQWLHNNTNASDSAPHSWPWQL